MKIKNGFIQIRRVNKPKQHCCISAMVHFWCDQVNTMQRFMWFHSRMYSRITIDSFCKISIRCSIVFLPFFFVFTYSAYRKVKHCRINVEGRLYVVGELLFESLVSLVNYYTRNPLYRNVKLTFPISKDVLKTMAKKYGNGGPLVSVIASVFSIPISIFTYSIVTIL